MNEQPAEPDDRQAADGPDVAGGSDGVGPRSRFETLREWFKRSELGLEAKYDELETHRGDSASVDVAFRVIEADRRVAGGLISGGMAFRIFVVIVPFAFVLVTVFGYFGEFVDASDPEALAKSLGMTGLVASTISASVDSSTTERVATLLAASYALLWGTWTLIRATRAVHGLAWGLPKLPPLTRPWRPTLFAIGCMFAAFLVGAGLSRLADLVDPLAEVVARILALGVVIAAWVGTSSLLPRVDGTTWRALMPGAVIFGVGMEVLQFLTVYFFSNYIASKTATYGAIGAALAILLWAYLGGRLIVTSAFVNAARWRQSRPDGEPGVRRDPP
ncbi:MAG: YihY/virulence factor BrkB family protein [Acidimicrobiia bacterium]|nr:YihY/virulence factor BrkB family protein [Acidimicrobiia bacterium]